MKGRKMKKPCNPTIFLPTIFLWKKESAYL
jgi:hypothetical protein